MSQEIPWHKTLGMKLGAVTLALLAASLLLVVGNFYTLSSLRGDAASLALFTTGRMHCYEMLYLGNRLIDEPEAGQQQWRGKLDEVAKQMDSRFDVLEKGDADREVSAVTDRAIRELIEERKRLWNEQIKPVVERLTTARSHEEAAAALADLNPVIHSWVNTPDKGVMLYHEYLERKAQLLHQLLYGFLGVVLGIVGVVSWIGRGIAGRVRSLARVADRIAAGELSLSAAVKGTDEVAALGEAFNAMTRNLRGNIEAIRKAVGQLTAASAEILASTTQQAAGAQEQASAVSETVATVDEVLRTSEQAAQRAKSVGEAVQRTQEIGNAGRKAVEDSSAALGAVKERVELTAENILALAEQAQAIGEIIATVNDIAEQTNLLALNAAIEASRAGEHGKGFSVVAGEVKALADQSKKATAQVRQILGEIQKATNTAVLSTEEVTKGVTATTKVAAQAGETIRALTETLAETAQAAAQIVASAGQQATGMAQIHQAIKNIDQVTKQNTAATRQVEQAAQNLNTLSGQLAELAEVESPARRGPSPRNAGHLRMRSHHGPDWRTASEGEHAEQPETPPHGDESDQAQRPRLVVRGNGRAVSHGSEPRTNAARPRATTEPG